MEIYGVFPVSKRYIVHLGDLAAQKTPASEQSSIQQGRKESNRRNNDAGAEPCEMAIFCGCQLQPQA